MKLNLRVGTLGALLVLLVARIAVAADEPPAIGMDKVSQSPIIIRGQLDLGVIFARQVLDRLRRSPSQETPESLQATIQESYVRLRLAHSGMLLKRQANRNVHFVNPVLEMAYEEMDKAMGHIRNAHQLAYSMAPERTDIVRDIMAHLENVIAIVDGVETLI